MRWFAPFEDVTCDAFLEQYAFLPLREGRTGIEPANAFAFDPGHPLVHLHLALVEEDTAQRASLIESGLRRLQRPENATVYGQSRWVEQLRTGREILIRLGQDNAASTLDALIDGE